MYKSHFNQCKCVIPDSQLKWPKIDRMPVPIEKQIELAAYWIIWESPRYKLNLPVFYMGHMQYFSGNMIKQAHKIHFLDIIW